MSQLIHEAFQELKGLKEATFSFDKPGIFKLKSFLDDDSATEDNIITMYDPEAETEGELKDNYTGTVVLKCSVCGNLLPMEPSQVVIDEETHLANVDMQCPCCYNTSGYTVVSEIKPVKSFDDLHVEEPFAGDSVGEEEFVEDYTGGPVDFVDKVGGVSIYKTSDGKYTATAPGGKSVTANTLSGVKVKLMQADEDSKKKLDRLPESKKSKVSKKAINEAYDSSPSAIAKFLKEAVEDLAAVDGGCYIYKLNNRLAVIVGFADGFDPNNSNVIHSEEEPSFAIVAGLKVWTSDALGDYEFYNFPYDEETREVYAEEEVISPEEDYDRLASHFAKVFADLKDLVIREDGAVVEHDDAVEAPYDITYYYDSSYDYDNSDTERYKTWKEVKDAFESRKEDEGVYGMEVENDLGEVILAYEKGKVAESYGCYRRFKEACGKGKRRVTESVKIISSLDDYEPWSGAQRAWDVIVDADMRDAFDSYLEDIYPEGLTMTELNDILRFDGDSVLADLGLYTEDMIEEQLDGAMSDLSTEEFDDFDDLSGRIEDEIKDRLNGVDVEVGRSGDIFTVRVNDVEKDYEITDYNIDDLSESLKKGKTINEHISRANIIEFPSGDYVYVMEKDSKLIAGSATNTGIIPEYEIEIDGEEATDSELQDLYDKIIAEHPEYEDELTESKGKKLNEQVSEEAYEVAEEIEAKIGDKTSVSMNEFAELFADACKRVIGTTEPPEDFETDVRSILSMSGLETEFEGENEGGLSRMAEAKEKKDLWDEVYDHVIKIDGLTDKNLTFGVGDFGIQYLTPEQADKISKDIEAKFGSRGVEVSTGKRSYLKQTPHYVTIKVPESEIIQDVDVKKGKKQIEESVSNIQVTTDTDVVSVDTVGDGVHVDVTPAEADVAEVEESGEPVLGPVDEETKEEIESNGTEEEEETVEETEEGTESEEAFDEFNEEEFNELGESYLKSVYDNVDSFKTTKGYINNGKIKLEGLIKFTSGKVAKTSFLFENYTTTARGKYKLIGENLQLTNRKNAFILTGSVKDKKLCLEALTYNYTAKDAKSGKSVSVYGTKRIGK